MMGHQVIIMITIIIMITMIIMITITIMIMTEIIIITMGHQETLLLHIHLRLLLPLIKRY